jgi:hypothetical protein
MMNPSIQYLHLKYPSLLVSCLSIVTAMFVLLLFCSNSLFTYEFIHMDNRTIPSNIISDRSYIVLESGSLGIWTLCTDHLSTSKITCDDWTKETRPKRFNTLRVLVSCVLFLSNLIIFPSFASFILLNYNRANCYLRAIIIMHWILLAFSSAMIFILFYTLLVVHLTKFHSPGQFIFDAKQLIFYSGSGLIYLYLGK